VPHIGHAYTTIAADVLARYWRKKIGEKNVFFLTGTDEHGAKIALSAEDAGKNPKEFVDSLVPKFQKTWKNLNIEYNYFIRTTNKEHEKFVQDFILKIKENGFIEKRKYEGLYCVSCEKFLTKADLVDGCCPDHKGKKPIKHSEENWFFKLSKLEKELISAIEKDKYFILPKSRKNEIFSKINLGLEDVSISRSGVRWGITVPWDKSQTIYVWFDALLNYLSALTIVKPSDTSEVSEANKFWPPDVQLMAKDILWFHTVIWPAMLIAASNRDNSLKGDCPLRFDLPKKIFAHGFFTINGQKMSKTLRNVIDPNELSKKYGGDAVRYCLLTAFPFGEDGDISEEEIDRKYNSELANELGNLVNRVISMASRYNFKPRNLKIKVENSKLDKYIETFRFDEALKEIWGYIREANSFVEQSKPWEIAKSNPQKLENVFNKLFTSLNEISHHLTIFLPETSEKIKLQLRNLKPELLFPRIK
jgi:methionyl-tRNA synthetase